MSRYLIRRIEDHPAIGRHVQTEIVSLEGNGHSSAWAGDNQTGLVETHGIRHVFTMTGAGASITGWPVASCSTTRVPQDGPDLSAGRPGHREVAARPPPHLLETSRPGVFAIAMSGPKLETRWPRPWARDRSRSPRCIRCCTVRHTRDDHVSLANLHPACSNGQARVCRGRDHPGEGDGSGLRACDAGHAGRADRPERISRTAGIPTRSTPRWTTRLSPPRWSSSRLEDKRGGTALTIVESGFDRSTRAPGRGVPHERRGVGRAGSRTSRAMSRNRGAAALKVTEPCRCLPPWRTPHGSASWGACRSRDRSRYAPQRGDRRDASGNHAAPLRPRRAGLVRHARRGGASGSGTSTRSRLEKAKQYLDRIAAQWSGG